MSRKTMLSCFAATAFLCTGVVAQTETRLTKAAGHDYDQFGKATATDGDAIVVGMPTTHNLPPGALGAAVVFRRDGAGWAEEQTLTASDTVSDDKFGCAVAVDGDVIVVGAYRDDVGGFFDTGSAMTFRRNGGAWVEEQQLVPITLDHSDLFGYALAASNGVIAVGAPYDDVQQHSSQGSVTVFRWNGVSWIEEALLSPTGRPNDRFGTSVALHGNVLVAGAPGADVDGKADQGLAAVYRWNGLAWQLEQMLTITEGEMGDIFGMSVSVWGSQLAVGAPYDTVDGVIAQGSATVFRWDGNNWNEQQKLSLSDGAVLDHLGWSGIAIQGRLMAVGAAAHDVGSNEDQGRVEVFRWNGTNWGVLTSLTASDGASNSLFGHSLAMFGGTVVVGAPSVGGPGGPPPAYPVGYAYAYTVLPWSQQGNALPGMSGAAQLVGNGPLTAGSSNTIELSNAAPSALAGLFVGLEAGSVPFKGGTLVPLPLLAPLTLATTSVGAVVLPFDMPVGVPSDTELYFQWAIDDPGALHGVALSNAILGVAP